MARCLFPLPLNVPGLLGPRAILLRCSRAYGHRGRHESLPPIEVPLSWPAGTDPRVTWATPGGRKP